MTLRFGCIGLDHWYNAFPTLDALAARRDATLVAVVHSDATQAREVAERYGARVLPSPGDLLARDDIDVALVFTSADQTASASIGAMRAGKHVVAIKPMAMNLADADRVVQAVAETGVHYFPNDAVRRFNPANQQIQAWIEEGHIGDPVAGTCVFRAGLPKAWPTANGPGWFADTARTPGGAFIDHAVYHVDLLRWLFKAEVATVTGMMANVKYRDLAVEDYGHAVLRFDGGQVGAIEDTWTSGPGASKEALEIVGTRGSIINDTATGRILLTGYFGLAPEGWIQLTPPPFNRGAYLDHVIRVVRGESSPVSTATDARANLAACLAVYEAARNGRTVDLPMGGKQ